MKNLKLLRKSRNLTLQDVASVIFVREATVWQWENGRRQPSIENLKKLADFYRTTIDFIVDRDFVAQDDMTRIMRVKDLSINREKIVPLVEKIVRIDTLDFLRLEGYVDALVKNKEDLE